MALSVLKIPEKFNQTANNFALLGDSASVITMKNALIDHCSVMNETLDNFPINPNQVVSYYRASSFALLLQSYDNGQPLELPTGWTPNTTIDTPIAPMPKDMNSAYLVCLNSTISRYLPMPYENAASSNFALLHLVAGNSSPMVLLFALIGFLSMAV